MNLAGESLVEARRLEPYVASLHKLGQRQAQLAELIGEIALQLQDADLDKRVLSLVAAARARALECRHTTMERMTEIDAYARRAEDLTERLYRAAITSRMRPFADGLHGFQRMVRDLSRRLDKQVDLTIVGDTIGVDRDILEKLEAPLNHLLRNSIDHGLESPAQREAAGKPPRGQLRLEARHWAGMLSVTVSDDGRGIDLARVRDRVVQRGLVDAAVAAGLGEAEVLDYLFVSGFSTSDAITEISGRGVGLDVVRSVVEEVGGSVRVSSELGKGTTFHLQLPITLSVIRGVLVEISGEPYAFPMIRIERIVTVPRKQIRTLESRQYFMLEDRSVGLVSGHEVLDLPPTRTDDELVPVVVLSDRAHVCGVAVDRFLGEHDFVIRALDPRLGKVADISSAAILIDGSPVLIIDVEDMVRSIVRLLEQGQLGGIARPKQAAAAPRILIVDDSITVREVQRQLLANRGYEVAVAVDGMDGWHSLRDQDFDLVITDVDMPRMNGIDLVRSIKQDARLRDTPVMIVSYRDRDEDRQRGLEAGANYYLTKSGFHDVALLEAVADLIGEPA
jgi:two-component system sensor histidine kinase and response regulator WspE